MGVGITIRLHHEDLKRLKALPKNARFAGAVALTKTAKDAQAALKVEAGAVFHLRNSWVPQGIRIEAAKKSTMSAKVGSIDKYMARHVFGDDKSPDRALSIRRNRDSRGRLATGGLLVPNYGSIGQAPKHPVTARRLARIDGQKKKTFQIAGRGGVLVVRRTSKKRKPLEILASVRPKANEDQIWRMHRTVSGVVGARFSDHFEAALLQYAK